MKCYNQNNYRLGFFELNFKIFTELFSDTKKLSIRDNIEAVNSLSLTDEDNILNIIYSPNFDLDFTKILSIFSKYKWHPNSSIYKRIKEYFMNRGLVLTRNDEDILFKAIKTGKLYERIKKFRKDILIVKKNTLEDITEDDLLFAEVIVNGNDKSSKTGNKLRMISSKQIVNKNYPAIQDLSDSSILSDYNISKIKEVKKAEALDESYKFEDKNMDEIEEDL